MKETTNNRPLGVPITPDQAKKEKSDLVPEYVIEAVNNLIIKNLSPSSFIIRQNDLISEILKIKPNITKKYLYEKKYYDKKK